MNPWTDMDALCAAIRRTKTKGEAAALLATWRAPSRAKQLPLRMPAAAGPENNTMTPEEQVAAGRAAIRAIEANEGKAVFR